MAQYQAARGAMVLKRCCLIISGCARLLHFATALLGVVLNPFAQALAAQQHLAAVFNLSFQVASSLTQP